VLSLFDFQTRCLKIEEEEEERRKKKESYYSDYRAIRTRS
jgi:hypothetical protein